MPAVFGWIGSTLAAGGVGAALLRLGGSLLLSLAAQALMPRPTPPDNMVTLRNPVSPREIVYGRARKGGTIVYIESTDSNDRMLHMVIVLAAHRVKSLGAVYFDGEMAFNASGTVQSRWNNRAWLDKRLGTDNQTAFSINAPGWTSNHRLRGCAAIYLRLRFDRDVYPGGIPNVTVDIEGKDDILDPRTGVRGYSENPALCLADYMSLERFGLGMQIDAADGVQEDALIEAANICDEVVALDGGGDEPRYNLNGVIPLSETPKTIIEGMLSAMAGRVAWHGGQFHIHAGAYREPTITLTADDVMDGGMTLATRVSARENFNAVRGQFVSPENDWQPDDFPAYESSAYLAEDGGERKYRDIVLPFTLSATMAQRLAKIELERARRQQSVRMSGKLSAYRAVIGETVDLSYAPWGFEEKPFEVIGMSLDMREGPYLAPELVLRETSPLVYDWEASEAQIYEAAPRSNLPSAFDIEPPGVPTVSEELYPTRDGTGVKVLARLEWTAAESSFVDRYEVQARRIETPGGTETGDQFLDRGVTQETRFEIFDVAPGLWQFRVRSVSLLGVRSEWRQRQDEILGLTAPPAQLQNVSIQAAGGLAIIRWTPSTDLDVLIGGRIVIRHSAQESPAWANSVSMDEVAGADGVAVVPLKPGTYLVRARDSSRNYGPAAMVETRGAQVLGFANIDTLIEDPVFDGDKTNCEVDTGALTITDVSQKTASYVFDAGFDFTTVKSVRLRSDILVTGLNLGEDIDDRTDPIDTWLDFDGTDGAEIDVVVEARTTDDDPGDDPEWSGWSRIDSSEVEARGVQCRALLSTQTEDFNVLVSRLRVNADEVA